MHGTKTCQDMTLRILFLHTYMASTDEQSSGLLSWHAARQPEMNQQIFAGIVESQWLGFDAIDLCFEEHGQSDAKKLNGKHKTLQQLPSYRLC